MNTESLLSLKFVLAQDQKKRRSKFTSFNFLKIKVGMYYKKCRYVSKFYYYFIPVQF